MRHPARLILTGAALLVVSACNNESSVAPLRAAPTIAGSPALAELATPRSFDFEIPAKGGRVSILGVYTLDFPANSVCDPTAQNSREGYAAAAWDMPCTPATENISVHVTLQWSHNRLWADFSPSLRFVPSQVVTISTDVMSPLVRYYADDNNGDGSNGRSMKWGILFAPSIDGTPVDDAKADPSLRTVIDFRTGRIWRRFKHFSGYNIYTGLACTLSPNDPFCVERLP